MTINISTDVDANGMYTRCELSYVDDDLEAGTSRPIYRTAIETKEPRELTADAMRMSAMIVLDALGSFLDDHGVTKRIASDIYKDQQDV